MAQHTMDFVDVPDGYLYYEQHGEGPDVVLVNGGFADLRMWDATADHLPMFSAPQEFREFVLRSLPRG